MYILAELHYGINPDCNAMSGNKMIRTTETEFTWKNKPEHLRRSTATFKRYACKSLILKLVSNHDWPSSTALPDGKKKCLLVWLCISSFWCQARGKFWVKIISCKKALTFYTEYKSKTSRLEKLSTATGRELDVKALLNCKHKSVRWFPWEKRCKMLCSIIKHIIICQLCTFSFAIFNLSRGVKSASRFTKIQRTQQETCKTLSVHQSFRLQSKRSPSLLHSIPLQKVL